MPKDKDYEVLAAMSKALKAMADDLDGMVGEDSDEDDDEKEASTEKKSKKKKSSIDEAVKIIKLNLG